jgi:hypothetical protein
VEQDLAYNLLRNQDFYLAPICILILLFFARAMKKNYQDTPLEKYVFPAMGLRLLGVFVYTLVIRYYYGFGDSHNYYQALIDMYHAVKDDSSILWDIILKNKMETTDRLYNYFVYDGYGYTQYYMMDHRSYNVPRMALPFALIFQRSFLCVSFCISYLSFLGSWRIFKMFYEMYPHLHRKLAYGILFLPSVIFWGTSLLKDSFSVVALGFFVYAAYSLLIKRRKVIISAIILYITGNVLFILKPYILICISAVFLLWFFMLFRKKIKDKISRTVSTLLFIIISALAGFFISQAIAKKEAKSKFLSGELLLSIKAQQTTFSRNLELGSGSNFSIGKASSPLQLALLFPLGIVNTYFRPFPWDVMSPIMLLSCLESLCYLAITIMCFRRVGFGKTFNIIFSDPVISFCFVFAILFGAIIGIATSNFGALVRYKIPILAFYVVTFILVMDKSGKFSNTYIFSKKLF